MSSFSPSKSQSRVATTSKTDIVNCQIRILKFAITLDLKTQFPSIIGVLRGEDLTHSLICGGARLIKASAIPHPFSIDEGVSIAGEVEAIDLSTLQAEVVHQLVFVVSQSRESLGERGDSVA